MRVRDLRVLSTRLDPEPERLLLAAALAEGRARRLILGDAIRLYCDGLPPAKRARMALAAALREAE
jgi:hypothetical protein